MILSGNSVIARSVNSSRIQAVARRPRTASQLSHKLLYIVHVISPKLEAVSWPRRRHGFYMRQDRFVFSVTSGRSGTTLLTKLAQCVTGVHAEHEGRPRLNYVMRAVLNHSEAAKGWLLTEFYPSIRERAGDKVYFDPSHLFCKGFIEPTLDIGITPKFIILRRPAREVASSLFSINCIPERTSDGRLVLIGPSDLGHSKLDWQSISDYGLCYWYAKEMERRQNFYTTFLPVKGCQVLSIDLGDIPKPDFLSGIASFLTDQTAPKINWNNVLECISTHQNPRSHFVTSIRELPP